jgi:UDP-glucuronate decarboxylase
MKRILVTGGAGFLGSHLCKRLVKAGHDVMCLDNLYTGNKSNVAELVGCNNFQFVQHNVAEPFAGIFDEIYNLACPASPVHYQNDPVGTTRTSVWGAYNMLELARKCGAKILQASTSEVYGDPEVHPQPESYKGSVNPIGPRACYDEGKRCAESLFFDYNRQYGVKIKVVRIFNTYGPNMHPEDGRVVSNFIMQALQNQPITIYGDGSQTRSFCYVDDMIDGFVRMMEMTQDFTTGPVNLGNPGEFNMKQLAEKIVHKVHHSSFKSITTDSSIPGIDFKPLPADDPKQRKPDISLAKQLLGWEPKISLDVGLDRTIAYFAELTNAAKCEAL